MHGAPPSSYVPDWKKVPARTRTDSLSDIWSYVTLSAALETVRHFQSSRRKHANVRIKRLTIVINVINEMLIVYIFLV
jgi:hypothetical protein